MHGVRLATSTLGPQLTPKVQHLLESSGGKYHKELRNPLSADATRPATTHLIVFHLPGNPLPSSTSETTEKIAAAKRWGVRPSSATAGSQIACTASGAWTRRCTPSLLAWVPIVWRRRDAFCWYIYGM